MYDIALYLIGEIIIDDNVNSLNINSSAEQIGGHQNTLVELLEVSVWERGREREREREWGVRER